MPPVLKPFILGWEEWVALPELGLPAIKAKVDTGARTSALHAYYVQPFGSARSRKIRFGIHPVPRRDDISVECTARLIDRREVRSSNGEREQRYVIETPIQIGDQEWPIEVTLTNRNTMTYRMLLGRQAIADGILVDPASSFLQPKLRYTLYGRREGWFGARPRCASSLADQPEHHRHRDQSEDDAAGHEPDEHALGAGPRRAQRGEGQGPERGPPPVQQRRIVRAAERIAGRVGDEQRAEEHEQGCNPAAVEQNEIGGLAACVEEAHQRRRRQRQHHPGRRREVDRHAQRLGQRQAYAREGLRTEVLADDRPTAPDRAKMAPNATGVMRPITAQAATAASLKRAIVIVTKALLTGVATLASTAGSAESGDQRHVSAQCRPFGPRHQPVQPLDRQCSPKQRRTRAR